MNHADRQIDASGDRAEQFMRLFLANRRRIYGFIATLVPCEADAEDLLQDTNAIMWRKFDEFDPDRPDSSFSAWGIAIARHQVMKHQRSARSKPMTFNDDVAREVADEYLKMETELDARRDALNDCVAKLSDRHRSMVAMRYAQGMTTRHVAQRFDVTVFTIYKTLNRIHASLMSCIEQATDASRGTPR